MFFRFKEDGALTAAIARFSDYQMPNKSILRVSRPIKYYGQAGRSRADSRTSQNSWSSYPNNADSENYNRGTRRLSGSRRQFHQNRQFRGQSEHSTKSSWSQAPSYVQPAVIEPPHAVPTVLTAAPATEPIHYRQPLSLASLMAASSNAAINPTTPQRDSPINNNEVPLAPASEAVSFYVLFPSHRL